MNNTKNYDREKTEVSGYVEVVGNTVAMGTENVIQCIKDIGQYIIDNAEGIGNNNKRVYDIRIEGIISALELPKVEVSCRKGIEKASMPENPGEYIRKAVSSVLLGDKE